MVLLAPSWSGLQILIDKLHQDALANYMTFNVSKTACIIFKPVIVAMHYVISFQHSTRVGRYSLLKHMQFRYIWGTLYAMTCVMMRISKEKLKLYSQGAIYFLVDLKNVRVLSGFVFISFQTISDVYCMHLFGSALWTTFTSRTYNCLYRVFTTVWNVSLETLGMPSMIVSHTCLIIWV